MSGNGRFNIICEAKRYLMMKRAEGLGVIHPVDDEGELPPDDTKEKNPGADSPAGRNMMRFDEKSSIRYGGDPGAALQGSLFSVEKEADGPDLGNLDIEALEKLVSTCRRCPLSEGRNKAVFGSGPPDARIVFIGEAPGKDEDLQGVPFVGRAGKLLTKILAAVGLSRDEVYITNILKCRPPNNRDPNEEESRACEPYLRRQLELINPALICALGRVAGQNLLKSKLSLSVLRRGSHYYDDIKLLVTYHPAALLRNPNLKRAAWDDMKMVRKLYDESMGGI